MGYTGYTNEIGDSIGLPDYSSGDDLSPDVTRKTKTGGNTDNTPQENYAQVPKGINVLNKYRSFTYRFTLAALRKELATDPTTYRNSALDFVILKSGGKGLDVVQNVNKADAEKNYYNVIQTPNADSEDVRNSYRRWTNSDQTNKLIGGFNSSSPGRFDMFIDNVEIQTIMTSSEAGGMALPTNINFDVIEPYSINGFVEALHVTAVAAGYPTYTNAMFLLKVEFVGYPDDQDLPKPEIIDLTTRYFPIVITGLDVTIDEKGTKYQVRAIPSNEKGFGNPGQIKKPIKISGKTVKDILNSFMDELTTQERDNNKELRKNAVGPNDYDEYKIIFPKFIDGEGDSDGVKVTNDICLAKVSELLKENTLYKFPDPGETTKPTANQPKDQTNPSPQQNAKQPEYYKLEPNQPVVQFAEGKNIHECITAIIRDSQYVRNILEKLSSKSEWNKVVDSNGMVDYFIIKLQVENKPNTDPEKKRPYQIFTYVVTPYKLLYTRIPGYASQQIDVSKLGKLCVREYNYVYTGQNLDIINFKLNFNTLFFEAIPSAMGNPTDVPSRDSAGRDNKPEYSRSGDNISVINDRELPASPVQVSPTLTSIDANSGGQIQKDAYYAMAKAMHQAITDSKASMLTGDIDILGDPIYLVTGGIGNYSPKPKNKEVNRETKDGEAAFLLGEVLININFRNPIDIQPLEQGGRMFFDPALVPFSGIYRVIKVKSTFKDGLFKQSLEIIRQPGQPLPEPKPTNQNNSAPTDPSQTIGQRANPDDTQAADSSPATEQTPGTRPDVGNLAQQLDRGLPSPGLPGALSNFTNATGGLGGTIPIGQTSGATNNLFVGNNRLTNQIFGGVIPGGINQPASGIPISLSGIANLQTQILSPAALINQVGQNISNSLGLNGTAASLASQIVRVATQQISKTGIVGSGIGQGATIQFNQTDLSNPSAYDLISNNNNPVITAQPNSGFAGALTPNTLNAVASLNDQGAGVVNNVQSNVLSAVQGNNSDPLAIANQFGINQSQLSGLSPNIQSKILSQLTNIANSIPVNVDIASAVAQGVNIRQLDQTGLSNLPATSPYSTAPQPAPDKNYLSVLAQSGGPNAIARSYGVNNIREVPQSQLNNDGYQTAIANSPQTYQNPFTQLGRPTPVDLVAAANKLLASRSILNSSANINSSVEGNFIATANQLGATNLKSNLGNSVISKFGSKSSGQSPLDKIMLR
jgi:hypothetical protein